MKGFALLALYIFTYGSYTVRVAAVEPVSEAMLVRVVPVLRAWGSFVQPINAGTDSVSDSTGKGIREWIALMEEIRAGTVDPFAWLKEHAPALRIPPLLNYSTECSRIASGLAMSPVALFSFGIEASEYGSMLITGSNKTPSVKSEELAETEAQKKVNGVVNAMRTFFREEKYPDFTNEAPLYWSTASPDSSLRITMIEANVYRAWGCDMLPTGPLLEIAWNEVPDSPAVKNRAVTVEDLKTILGKAGMSEQEFFELVTALVVARRDQQNPSALRFDDSHDPESADEEKLLNEVKRMVEVRKRNSVMYEKYGRTLDPLLDQFEKTGE